MLAMLLEVKSTPVHIRKVWGIKYI